MFTTTPFNTCFMTELPATMQFAFVRRTGPADSISTGRWPVPECGPAGVLIKASALAVNHVYLFVRSGAYQTPLPMPFGVGRACVGRVVAAGLWVHGF